MKIITAVVLPSLLALGACATPYGNDPYGQSGYPPQSYPPQSYPAPYPEPYPQPYPAPPGSSEYRASGTEPFWDLTIGRDMVFTDRGTGQQIIQTTPQVTGGVAGNYRTQRLNVNIVRTPCNDGMSDRSYPDTVQVYADGRLYRGCGGLGDSLSPAPPYAAPVPPVAGMPGPPLDRTRWRVVAINGRPVPPNADYAMEFDAGKLSARFGCNSIGAGYTQSGATIDAGVLIATRMACPDMSWENQGSAILDQVMSVSALAPNRITLSSSAGSIELMRH